MTHPFITDAQATQKIQESYNDIVNSIGTGFKGTIKIADTPTEEGIYIPTEAGVYPNAGGLEYAPEGDDEGYVVLFINNGSEWVKSSYPLPGVNVVEGKVEEIEERLKYGNNLDFFRNPPYLSKARSSSGGVFDATLVQGSRPKGMEIQIESAQTSHITELFINREVEENVFVLKCVLAESSAPDVSVGMIAGDIEFSSIGIFYRTNGSLFVVTSTGTDNDISIVNIRAATPSLAYSYGDEVRVEVNRLKGTFRSWLNGVWSSEFPIVGNWNQNINIGLRGKASVTDLIIYFPAGTSVDEQEIQSMIDQSLTPVYEALDSITGEKTEYFKTDISHIFMYGQSLAVGTKSMPALTLSQKYNSLRFEGGLRKRYDEEGGNINPNYYDSFIPLVEYDGGSPERFGETPCSGISESIISALLFRGIDYVTNNDVQLLLSAPGRGSTTIAGLSKGSDPYSILINEVVKGKELALAHNKTYSVGFICWNQGEADIDAGTTKEAYKSSMIQLQVDLNADIKAITGQMEDVVIVQYQVSSHNVRPLNLGYTGIAEAQLELGLEEDNIIISNATYFLPYDSDAVHLNNKGSKWNGACHGVAIEEFIRNDREFKPIHVLSSFFQGKVAELTMYAPVLPLKFDTVTVANPGNYGFRLFNSSGVEKTIISVEIKRGNTIKIISSADIEIGDEITYAINGTSTGATSGSRGNLKDSKEIIFDEAGINVKISNWCPIFRYKL